MEKKERNLALEKIINIVKAKYPNFSPEDPIARVKMVSFLKVIKSKEELKTFNFVDYSLSYLIRLKNDIDLETISNDILSIAVIFEEKPKKMENITQDDMDNYIKIVRTCNCEDISKLNKIILNNEILSKLSQLKPYFKTEEIYLNNIRNILSTALFRFRILRTTNYSIEEATIKVREDIQLTIENALNDTNKSQSIELGKLCRVLKPKNQKNG